MAIINLAEYAHQKAAQAALDSIEREGGHISSLCEAALNLCGGDPLAAADLLGFARGSMWAEAQLTGTCT